MPLMRLAVGRRHADGALVGGRQVIARPLGLGDLVAFIGYLNLLAWPTMALGWMLSIVQRGRAAMQRLEQIFAVAPDDRATRPDAAPLARRRGAASSSATSRFAYPGAAQRRTRCSTTCRSRSSPARSSAIVGRTGAGKTLARAAAAAPVRRRAAGAVLLDGRDVRDLPLAELRGAIGFVPQDPFLFSTTHPRQHRVRRSSDAERRATSAAPPRSPASAADLEAFPHGYDTMVGERGITLSGGQKQRLTLARALAARSARSWCSTTRSRASTRAPSARILRALREVMRGRTSIVIAHRISTVMDADRIVVLDDGRIVELGDHAALLARDGLYAELFRQQQLEEEIEEL